MMYVSAGLCLLACLILTVDLTLGLRPNKNIAFTFILPAGTTECFYQTTAREDSMEVDYQVNIIFTHSFSSDCVCLLQLQCIVDFVLKSFIKVCE